MANRNCPVVQERAELRPTAAGAPGRGGLRRRSVVEEGQQRRLGRGSLPSPRRASPGSRGCLRRGYRRAGQWRRAGLQKHRRFWFGGRCLFGCPRSHGPFLRRRRMPRIGRHAVRPQRTGGGGAAAHLVLLAAAAIDAAQADGLQQRLAAVTKGAQLVGGQAARIAADDSAVDGLEPVRPPRLRSPRLRSPRLRRPPRSGGRRASVAGPGACARSAIGLAHAALLPTCDFR